MAQFATILTRKDEHLSETIQLQWLDNSLASQSRGGPGTNAPGPYSAGAGFKSTVRIHSALQWQRPERVARDGTYRSANVVEDDRRGTGQETGFRQGPVQKTLACRKRRTG